MARALVCKFADAEHLRLERQADGVQQVGQRPVARSLPGGAARCTHPPEIGKVRLNHRRQLGVRSRHQSSSLLRRLRSKFLKSINPRFKVGTLGPDVLQANTLGHLRAYRCLQVVVLGELGDDSLRWSGLLPVVDQFRELDVIDDFLQSEFALSKKKAN